MPLTIVEKKKKSSLTQTDRKLETHFAQSYFLSVVERDVSTKKLNGVDVTRVLW